MRAHTVRLALLGLLAASLGLAGCFAAVADPTKFYVLTSNAKPASTRPEVSVGW